LLQSALKAWEIKKPAPFVKGHAGWFYMEIVLSPAPPIDWPSISTRWPDARPV
jgi:hypothetical protein